MFVRELLLHLEFKRGRGIVFAAGGSADIILAKNIAVGLVSNGWTHVDIAQPLNCKKLSDQGLMGEAGEFYKVAPETDIDPESVLKHYSSVPIDRHPEAKRGKGLSISSSLRWDHGGRYLCAALGQGPGLLAKKSENGQPFYDFAIGVDGGGDVLTHGDDEFDRIVLNNFSSSWKGVGPLILVATGLGADGGSAPEEFDGVQLEGWQELPTSIVDKTFAQSLQEDLEKLGLWNHRPSDWSKDDSYWGYGLKVPQIIALAARNEFPFPSPDIEANLTMFPRRHELKLMDKRLLCEVRVFKRMISE